MPDILRDQLQTSLGAAYALQRELGGGGMSRVFVAREEALGRDVVVKVLSPDLAVGVSAERFAREIRLAARLQQANIVPVHAAGETNGLPFYTMPFVDGLSLRKRLEGSEPLPVGEVISVLRDVARALTYAHEHGVVHRDIKPENILLSGDAAVVTDFGIAKALSASRTQAPGGTLTQAGTSIGTPAYMAPEQAVGDPATDHRADIYAFGCVAYEMLAGHAPFADRPVHQLLAAHLTEVPPPVDAERPNAPRALSALVMRCLAKNPAERPRSARAVLRALDEVGPGQTPGPFGGSRRARPVVAAAALVALVAIAFGGWAFAMHRAAGGGGAAGDAAADHTLAVLPFDNLGDSSQAYFVDGITDAVRTKLTAVHGMTVIARASSMSYAGTRTPLPVIARELGVHYLLTGTVRFAGAGADRRVEVSPELVEVTPDRAPASRWAQSFDAAAQDVFGVQADIAGKVASAMQVALGSTAQAQLAQAPTSNPDAYDAFLRGEAIRNTAAVDPRSIRRAMAAYEEAVRLDSTMAPAWAALSQMATTLNTNSTPSPVLARTALTAAERAIALDSNSAGGYVALALYHVQVTLDLRRARAAVTRALALAPQDVAVRRSAALVDDNEGALESERGDLAEALRLDPRNAGVWSLETRLLLRLGRVGEARAAAERYAALAPTSLSAVLVRVLVEVAAGDLIAARQVIARAERDVPHPAVVAQLGQYYDLGWTLTPDDARILLALGPDAFDGDRAEMAIVRAQQYGWIGDTARARVWGDSAARAFAAQLQAVPTDSQRHLLRGLALAYARRGPEALEESARGLALQGPTEAQRESPAYAYFVYVAARAALLAGDRDQALRWLVDSRGAHSIAGPPWLRIEPTWAPLRSDPRFVALTSGAMH